MDLQLDGHHALVVGASGGLGQAICQSLATEGAMVTMADLKPPKTPLVGTHFLDVDLASEASIRSAVQSAEARQPIDF